MNIVLTPCGWEERIREGELLGACSSGRSTRSTRTSAYFAGWKVVVIVLWLPIAAFLSLIFQPTSTIEPIDVVVFLDRDLGRLRPPLDVTSRLLGLVDVLDDPGRAGLRASTSPPSCSCRAASSRCR